MAYLYGSICLSEIDKKYIKKVKCKDGVERCYLNIKVVERKAPSQRGDTHFVSYAPKKELQEEGKNYIIGDLKGVQQQQAYQPPTAEEISNSPSANDDDLPF